jgi:hypothetical protein
MCWGLDIRFSLVMNIYLVFNDEKDLHDVMQYGGHEAGPAHDHQPPGRVSFETSFDSKQPKLEPKLVVSMVHRHFIPVCYVSATKRIGIKRIAALPIGLKRIGN